MNYAVSKSEYAVRARDILEKRIATGRASAAATFETVHKAVPVDSIVRGRAMKFGFDGQLVVDVGGGGDVAARGVHDHALGQMCAKAGLPAAYVKDLLRSPEPWKAELATKILNDHFQLAHAERNEDVSQHRHLVRAVDGQVRGFLSDRYRRLDSRPLLEAFAGECSALGAVPVEGIATDTRVSIRALLPHVFEPVPNEVLCLGGEWSNSDFGAGKHAFRAFILRLTCLNGATMEDAMAQVHLGGRLSDDIEFSDKTFQLDTRTSVSALKDVVRGVLSPKSVDMSLATIKAAHEKQIDWKGLGSKLSKRLLKEELKAVKDAFESNDVINLPPVQSAWRASNAVSWIAGTTEDPTRRQELQRLAGELVNGKVDAAGEAA